MKTLYRGGKIITMEQDFTAEALLTDGGRIAAVGSEERLAALGAQRVVDLAGGALLPGFLDAHSHFSQVSAAQGRRRWVLFLSAEPGPNVTPREYLDHNVGFGAAWLVPLLYVMLCMTLVSWVRIWRFTPPPRSLEGASPAVRKMSVPGFIAASPSPPCPCR